jgi:thiol-disulfide isomerase/thioredoxin
MLLNLLLWACDQPIIDSGEPLEEIIESPIHWAEDECSYNGGDHICNFRLPTAADTADEIYPHYGEIIVIDLTSMWCGPCQQAAGDVNDIKEKVEGVKWITIIIENEAGLSPSSSDGRRWGNAFELDYEDIWLGSRSNIDIYNGISGFPSQGWPYFVILDADLRIRVVIEGYNKNNMINKISDLKSEL